jgi:hypothetical protein
MTMQGHHHDGYSVRRRRPGGATALSLVLLAAACGPDAEGKFNDYVDEAKPGMDTGGTGGTGGTGEPTTGMTMESSGGETSPPEPVDLSGTALLAISTSVQPDLPLQFLSTVVQKDDGAGNITVDITLQPLSLGLQMVTMPRQPVGEPLTFKDIPVVDGKYVVDAGETMVTGMANPITGSDIVATLKLAATVVDADFVCGDVTGMVTMPLMTTIDGSTFASVRVDGIDALPTDVTINCARDTRTDG